MRSSILQIFGKSLNLRLILLYIFSCHVQSDLIEQSRHYRKPIAINISMKEKLQGTRSENSYFKEDEGFVNE